MAVPSTRERVETMLALLPWLGAREGATVEEICDRFGTDPETLRDDLTSVFLNVEPEVGPDHMIDVIIDGDWVTVDLADYFHRPPRLDHNEALLLLAAGTALQRDERLRDVLPGAVEKLADSLGPGAVDALEVDLGPADPEVLAELEAALAERTQVEMAYFSWGRDELADRVVDPWALRSIDGHWYLTGWCHLREAPRHFRVDRILRISPVGPASAFEVPELLGDPVHPEGEGQRVELRVPAEDSWMLMGEPVEEWREQGDDVVVVLRVMAEAYLDRLLLRLGPHTVALSSGTGESLAPRRRSVAAAILRRHGVDGVGRRSPVRSSG
jgi:proteasome accessory factor C